MKIAIVIGHGPKIDKGAVGKDGATELDWNRDLARRIVNRLSGRVAAVVINREVERQPPVAAVNRTEAFLAVELHCNAYNGKASGTEMIHHPGSARGKRLATLLQKAAVGVLSLPDRGVKGPQAGGRGAAFLSKTDMPAVIVETMFIDNPSDLQRANERKDQLAQAYADALVAFALA